MFLMSQTKKFERAGISWVRWAASLLSLAASMKITIGGTMISACSFFFVAFIIPGRQGSEMEISWGRG